MLITRMSDFSGEVSLTCFFSCYMSLLLIYSWYSCLFINSKGERQHGFIFMLFHCSCLICNAYLPLSTTLCTNVSTSFQKERENSFINMLSHLLLPSSRQCLPLSTTLCTAVSSSFEKERKWLNWKQVGRWDMERFEHTNTLIKSILVIWNQVWTDKYIQIF